jgi:hypothetical protein
MFQNKWLHVARYLFSHSRTDTANSHAEDPRHFVSFTRLVQGASSALLGPCARRQRPQEPFDQGTQGEHGNQSESDRIFLFLTVIKLIKCGLRGHFLTTQSTRLGLCCRY